MGGSGQLQRLVQRLARCPPPSGFEAVPGGAAAGAGADQPTIVELKEQ